MTHQIIKLGSCSCGLKNLNNYRQRPASKNHDVCDLFLALTRAYDANYPITTDGDFVDLCENEDLKYVNPVPAEKREKPTLIDG